jgi:hypothetical protein
MHTHAWRRPRRLQTSSCVCTLEADARRRPLVCPCYCPNKLCTPPFDNARCDLKFTCCTRSIPQPNTPSSPAPRGYPKPHPQAHYLQQSGLTGGEGDAKGGDDAKAPVKAAHFASNAFSQYKTLFGRELLSITRNPFDVAGRTLTFAWVGILMGILYYGLPVG